MITLTETYPNNLDQEIPIGIDIFLYFNKAVDLEVIKNSVVLYGRDYDQVRGPNSAVKIRDGKDPYLFRSPGFKGLVPVSIAGSYLLDDEPVDLEAFGPGDEDGHTYRVKIKPLEPLAAQVEYFLNILGDPDDLGKGVCSRTVWDPVYTAVSDTCDVYASGGYTGSQEDTLVIEITSDGEIGEAKYKWYWLSLGSGSAKTGRRTHSKSILIDKGVKVRFSGTGLLEEDKYEILCSVPERLSDTTKITFTTNDGSYALPPESPSTPAEQEPPSTIIPPFPGEITDLFLDVEMEPSDLSYNVSINTREIVLTFSEDLDDNTISADSVVVEALPVEGVYTGTTKPRVLKTLLTVDGNVLTITI